MPPPSTSPVPSTAAFAGNCKSRHGQRHAKTTTSCSDGDYTITLQSALPCCCFFASALLPAQTAAFCRPAASIVSGSPSLYVDRRGQHGTAELVPGHRVRHANTTADVIDLGGNTLSFDDGPYASPGDGVKECLARV